MKFLVERTVDGISKFSLVEANTPMDAMKFDDMESFRGAISGIEDERSLEITNHDVGTVGIYEVGQVNHLEPIVESADKISWASKRIEELNTALAWQKLNPKEKLLAVGYTEEIIQSLVENEDDVSLHNEIFEEELSLCAENQV